jgi:hypothetical protein
MSLLHRLSLSSKFLILALVALIMVVVPTGMYFNRLLADVNFAKLEKWSKMLSSC